ncbi:MAG: 2-C-methyl-D-erythritol 4-phosphate cytidylyltransferase [Ekhidna sp.]
MKEYAIIVAGGIGSRMGAEIPKQFLLIDDTPIIVHTINQFLLYSEEISIILILPEDHIKRWNELQANYFPNNIITVAPGGATRTESVVAGLNQINQEGLVAIHDAVRPFVSTAIIDQSFRNAKEKDSGVAAVAMKDSLREVRTNNTSKARDRADFVLVQTPQTFNVEKIKSAYNKAKGEAFSDDATVFENAGFPVHLIEGSYANIKITTPEDLA